MNGIQVGCFQKGGWHLFTESFMHFLHFIIVPEMKPILHFMLVCNVDLVCNVTRLSWTSSLFEPAMCPTIDELLNLI